jgi:hypothetical protein
MVPFFQSYAVENLLPTQLMTGLRCLFSPPIFDEYATLVHGLFVPNDGVKIPNILSKATNNSDYFVDGGPLMSYFYLGKTWLRRFFSLALGEV